MLTEIFSTKKNTWSAPAILTVVLFTGMVLIFCMESLGLANRHSDYIASRGPQTIHQIKEKKFESNTFMDKVKKNNEKSKEDRIKIMTDILIDSVAYQYRNDM